MNVEKQARNLICADDLNVPERRPGDYCPVCIAYTFSFTILLSSCVCHCSFSAKLNKMKTHYLT